LSAPSTSIQPTRAPLLSLRHWALLATRLLYPLPSQEESMFAYFALYSVLVCCEDCCALYGLDGHLKRYHSMPPAERGALLAAYEDFNVLTPAKVPQPTPCDPPIDALGPAQDAFLCRSSTRDRESNSADCSFITTSRTKMQQHSVKLTRWSSATTRLAISQFSQLSVQI
jgi:hypothetical protein